MYTFKNRSHYAQQSAKTTPTTWEQKVANREILWELGPQGLSYRVIGNRVNHGGAVVIPELARVVLYEGVKSSVHTPDRDVLTAIADAWAASVQLPLNEAYRGHNAQGEGPDSPQVSTCSTGTYPYFQV